MTVAPTVRCPSCQAELSRGTAKLNVHAQTCPRNHGVLLQRTHLSQLVRPRTTEHVQSLIESGEPTGVECPVCGASMGGVLINGVPAKGCGACGSLWFEYVSLQDHVLEVRQRAFGPGSFAARLDVHASATSLLPAEIVAGIVTDYDLELDDSSSTT